MTWLLVLALFVWLILCPVIAWLFVSGASLAERREHEGTR